MGFGIYLRELREKKNMLLRELAAAVQMDTALLSKIERGKRKARKEQVTAFAKALQTDYKELYKKWLAEKVYDLIRYEENPIEILRVAEEQAEYMSPQPLPQRQAGPKGEQKD